MLSYKTKYFGNVLTRNSLYSFNKAFRLSTNQRAFSSDASGDIKTSLYDFHVKNGGKLVSFANVLLPVQYADMSVSASHVHTRTKASIFDVSHMLQSYVRGKHCLRWLESICPVDAESMPDGSASLTVFLNERGCILDDLIVTKVDSNNLYIVSNAGRKTHDKQHMFENVKRFKNDGHDVDIHFAEVSEKSLIALQGPSAASALQKYCKRDLSKLFFMNSIETDVAGVVGCRVTRCGYTGEDGFEISVPSEKIEHVTYSLMENLDVKLAGLGARDSLRLEAGLCLYGNDIDDTITPIEANLAWLIQKRRRTDSTFIGANVVLDQLKNGVTKRRIGLRLSSGPPARRGAQITAAGNEEVIGTVTSGCPSPTLGGNIAMAYVKEEYKKPTSKLSVIIRNNTAPAEVTKMPFVSSKYYVKK
jgi:aminomethyltransferase